MGGLRKNTRTLGEHGIFGDEEAAKLQAEVTALRELVADLTERVHAQFTTISAHAEIARQHVEFAREEAHADVERTREMLIGLIERARVDLGNRPDLHVPGAPPGASVSAHTERIEALELRIVEIIGSLDRCFARQRILADTIEALLDTVLAERRGEPVAGLSLV
jgi:hypothetical protein